MMYKLFIPLVIAPIAWSASAKDAKDVAETPTRKPDQAYGQRSRANPSVVDMTPSDSGTLNGPPKGTVLRMHDEETGAYCYYILGDSGTYGKAGHAISCLRAAK